MTRKRRSFTAEFEARMALEAIKNQHTLQEIASRFEVRMVLICIGVNIETP